MQQLRKRKILHVIKSLGRGGAELLLPESLKLHNKEKYEFHYIYFLPWKDQVVDELKQAGGIVSCLNASGNIQILFSFSKLAAYIKRYEIELVHCHLPITGIVGRIIHQVTNTPVVYTEHNKQERYHWVTRNLNRLSFNYQTTAIAVSLDVKMSIDNYIHPKIEVNTIFNGINTGVFKREEKSSNLIREKYNIPQDALVIGTVAVFRFQKRMLEWLEVFSDVVKKYPKIYALLVGHGPYLEEMKRTIEALGIGNNTILTGLQSDVKPFYSAMDIFMMTSIYEGMPVALLEAMSMECAIVTTKAGGVGEVVRNKFDGFVVETDDWKELSKHLIFLIEDPFTIKKWGKQARQRVSEDFGMCKMVKQIEGVYDSILCTN